MNPLIEFEHPVSAQMGCPGLPLTRRDAFKDILKHHYVTLLKLGISLLAFSLPFFVVFSICSLNYDALYAQYQAGEISQTAFLEGTLSFYLFELLGFATSLLLLSLPLSFFSRILRSICFYDGFFFWNEGKKGIKENFLHCFFGLLLLASLSLGSSLLVLFVDFGTGNANWFTSVLAFLPLVATLLLLFPTCLLFYALNSIYQASFFKGLSNAFKIYLNSFFPTLGFSLSFFLPLLVLLIPNSLVAGGVLAALIVVYYPVLLLGAWLYFLFRFDKLINEENYPSLYQRGLFI